MKSTVAARAFFKGTAPRFAALFTTLVTAFGVTFVSGLPLAYSKTTERSSEKSAAQLPEKLPAKSRRSRTQRTYIDFSKDDRAVIESPRASALDKMLKKSDRDVTRAGRETTVRPRTILAAPPGDSAEPLSALSTAISKADPKVVSPPIAPPITPPNFIEIENEFEPSFAAKRHSSKPMLRPDVKPDIKPDVKSNSLVEINETSVAASVDTSSATKPRKIISAEPALGDSEIAPVGPEPIEIRAARVVAPGDQKIVPSMAPETAPETMVFIRTGYLAANYKKFDDRMKNGATSMGLGAAHGFETTWGAFEARAAFDAYHALDQSVTIDNIRMLSARTEIGYWFLRSRVKPGLSLGLGWADYSIRSYRSVSEAPENVTLRTHAKSRAFSVIPGAALRVELGRGLVVDVQTEFLALLGGDSADAAQGLNMTAALGWAF